MPARIEGVRESDTTNPPGDSRHRACRRLYHLAQMARYFSLDAVLEMISNLAKMSVDAKDEPARSFCISALLSEVDKIQDQIAAYRAAQQIKADPTG